MAPNKRKLYKNSFTDYGLLLALSLSVFFFIPDVVFAVDLFGELAMKDEPVMLHSPSWVESGSTLSFRYYNEEYYKRWLDKQLVNDFSGYRLKTEIKVELLEGIIFGAEKTFFDTQQWQNHSTDNAAKFNFDSNSDNLNHFFRFVRPDYVLEVGQKNGNSNFIGSYDLHKDIINALGENPSIHLNNRHKINYAQFYGERGRFRLKATTELGEQSHKVHASTPAMLVDLHLDRTTRHNSIELGWKGARGIAPFIRSAVYKDTGDADNMKNVRFRFGTNASDIKLGEQSIGLVIPYRQTSYFAEYSKLRLDVKLYTRFNLITLNPLFLFSTNEVDYQILFKPDNPWAIRLGGRRAYRGVEYFGQYSFASISGIAATLSKKSENMFATTINKKTRQKIDMNLHRLQLNAKRPDKHGHWQVQMNIMLPDASTKEIKPLAPPKPVGPPAPKKSDPSESIRGGWQVVIERQFLL